jgi:dGTPase
VDATRVDDLLRAIRENKVEPRMERKIGGFIRATHLREEENFLSDLSMRHRFRLVVEEEVKTECRLYKQMAYDQVFLSQQLKQLEYKGERMLSEMFTIFAAEYLERETPRYRLLPGAADVRVSESCDPARRARRLCDYMAGMTDGFATRTYKRLTDPDFGGIADLV